MRKPIPLTPFSWELIKGRGYNREGVSPPLGRSRFKVGGGMGGKLLAKPPMPRGRLGWEKITSKRGDKGWDGNILSGKGS
jgi:hypothetical protein